MTPEEAAAWAADAARDLRERKVKLSDEHCMLPDCLAPIYLNEMCSTHWRLLLGYAGHASIRDARERFEAHMNDPLVLELERLLKL